jgi:hypothetical protein
VVSHDDLLTVTIVCKQAYAAAPTLRARSYSVKWHNYAARVPALEVNQWTLLNEVHLTASAASAPVASSSSSLAAPKALSKSAPESENKADLKSAPESENKADLKTAHESENKADLKSAPKVVASSSRTTPEVQELKFQVTGRYSLFSPIVFCVVSKPDVARAAPL